MLLFNTVLLVSGHVIGATGKRRIGIHLRILSRSIKEDLGADSVAISAAESTKLPMRHKICQSLLFAAGLILRASLASTKSFWHGYGERRKLCFSSSERQIGHASLDGSAVRCIIAGI